MTKAIVLWRSASKVELSDMKFFAPSKYEKGVAGNFNFKPFLHKLLLRKYHS